MEPKWLFQPLIITMGLSFFIAGKEWNGTQGFMLGVAFMTVGNLLTYWMEKENE